MSTDNSSKPKANGRIALIGHSAAGKSACLAHLQSEPHEADMDCALGTKQCPSLEQALNWLSQNNSDLNVVVVSNHEEMLKSIHRSKSRGDYRDLFNTVRLIYLYKEKSILEQHLRKPTCNGKQRPADHIRYTLDNYERFDQIFREMADLIIDCSHQTTLDVAFQLQELIVR